MMAEADDLALSIRWQKILPFVLALLAVCLFANTFDAQFVWRDIDKIVEDESIRRLWPLSSVMAGTPRPLVKVSYAINYAIDGDTPPGYHVVNVLLHALAALALYGVVHQILLLAKFGDRFDVTAPWLAFAVALIWLVHPLVTQAVDYVSARSAVMVGFFFLLTVYWAVCGFSSKSPTPWHIAAAVACALGMATDPVMVAAPVIVLLIDRAFAAGGFASSLKKHRLLYAALAVTWLIALLLPRGGPAGTHWLAYSTTQLGVIIRYLRLSFWPSPLVLDYAWPAATSFAAVWLAGVVIIVLLIATIIALVRNSWLGVVGAWFFAILAPTSSIIALGELAVEHRMYLPLIAPVAIVVIGGYLLLERLASWRLRAVLGAVVVLAITAVFVVTTFNRNQQYRTTVALWQSVSTHRPDNSRGHYYLGVALREADQPDEALAALNWAAELIADKPADAQVYSERGVVLLRLGQVDKALADFEKALTLDPDLAVVHFRLGSALLGENRLDEAVASLRRAIELDADFAPSYVNLGAALSKQGQFTQAERVLRKLLKVDPQYADAHRNLGKILLDQGRVDESIHHYKLAGHLARHNPRSGLDLAQVYESVDRIDEAIEAYHYAMRYERVRPEAMLRLANLLATHPQDRHRNGQRALQYAIGALKLTGMETPLVLDTLAAALAELGQFKEAVEQMEKAVSVAEQMGLHEVTVGVFKQRLALYREGKPYRRAALGEVGGETEAVVGDEDDEEVGDERINEE